MGNSESKLESNQPVHDRYKIGRPLGSGSFGDVYEAVETSTNRKVAIKMFKQIEDYGDVLNEIEILNIADHDNVVQYITSYENENTICMVMEYCEFGHIGNFIKTSNPACDTRMCFTHDIASGIVHLHDTCHIVHRDLKPANILVTLSEDRRNIAKIADFGLAKMMTKTQVTGGWEYMYSGVGTFPYMAPEVIRDKKHYREEVDIFSMGLMFCGILNDRLKGIIEKGNVGQKMVNDSNYKFTLSSEILGDHMQALITQMIQFNYRLRPKAQSVKEMINDAI